MSHHRETNPHFIPRQRDPIIEIPSQPPPPRRHGRTSSSPSRYYGRTPVEPPPNGHASPPPRYYGRTSVEPPPHGNVAAPPRYYGRTPVEPPPHGRTSSPPHSAHPPTNHAKPMGPAEAELAVAPHGRHDHDHDRDHDRRDHHHSGFMQTPASRRTTPVAWVVAAFCTLFWVVVIVGGLVILIVYLVFRPRNPRFDISSTTFNAAYLDMGTLLNADVTVLANFTNPNSKVKVEFSYVILDLYYANNFVATRYIEPFSVMKGESKFADVHMMASQVKLSTRHSVQLQKQIEQGRVNLEIKGLFRARSRLGGIFRYSYWMYANCQLVVSGPPTGVLIHKTCVTKRNL